MEPVVLAALISAFGMLAFGLLILVGARRLIRVQAAEFVEAHRRIRRERHREDDEDDGDSWKT